MPLFSKKKKRYLGIDVGSSSIKIIELADEGGVPRLVNYGFAEKMHRVRSSRTEDIIGQSNQIIVEVCKQAGFTTKYAIAALHNFDVFTSVINLIKPRNNQELENIVKIEAHKFVPIPLEDVVLDWKVLRGNAHKNKEAHHENHAHKRDFEFKERESIDVLLTAAPRKLVKKYVDIFQAAHINLLSLETESFAFVRSLLDKTDNSSLMLIDIGAIATDIIIIEEQVPVIIRTVDVGGNSVTSAVERNLGITAERAEQVKRDVGLAVHSGKEGEAQSTTQVMKSAFSPIVNEIRYSIDLYKARNKMVEKIVLSGGSAHLLGLENFLKETFALPVFIGDPWHKVKYPAALKEILQDIGPMFPVAIGLALKEIIEK